MRDKALQSLRDAIPASDSLKAQAAHYIGIFEALPIPAILLDAAGTVIDVNEAFVDFGHQHKSLDSDSDRIGLSILECVGAPGGLDNLQTLIDGMLKRGEVGEIEGEVVDKSGRQATIVVRGTPLEDGDERIIGGVLLREDITERRRLEQRRHTILEVRDEVWTMRASQDIERVLGAVRKALRQLAVPFEDCGVNLVDVNSADPSVWFHSMRTDGRWGQVGPDVEGTSVVIGIWKGGETAYRRDLDAEDRYGERAQIEADLGRPIRSVVDVPFSHGTLAVNNARPDAFSQADIDILEELGQILSEGFLRLDDFRQLEERNRDLEIGILEREQAESALRESEEKLRSVVENAPDYIMTLDLDGRILYSNRMPPELEAGPATASIFDAAKTEYGDALRAHIEQTVATGANAAFEIEGRAGAGGAVWFDCRIAPVHRDGEVAELTMVLQDITARKEAEAVLHRSREELEALVERRTADLERAASERERHALQLRALQRVREEMWKMQYTNEIETVLVAVRQGLEDLALAFAECGINMVIDSTDPPIVRTFTTGASQWLAEHQDPDHPVIWIWRGGQIAYRRDLHAHDELAERQTIEGNYQHPVRSVIDLPFSHGTLAVNSDKADAFSEVDIAFMGEMAAVLSEVFKRIDDMRLMEQHTMMLESEVEERQRAEEELKRSLSDKEVLLQEIHHRVKNNMQIVSSLIDLQSRQTTDEQSLELFRDSRDRIRSMALVHELLYQSHDLARIDLPGYIRTLTTDLFFSYTVDDQRVQSAITVEDIALGIDMAIPCGLIINELVSNALKYAFPDDRKGTVRVTLSHGADKGYALQVADDGVGLPEDFDIRRTSSLGLTLVQTLVRQLRGELQIGRGDAGGTSFDIAFSDLPPSTLL